MSASISEFVRPPVARWRRICACVAVALAVLAVIAAVLGAWNPWSFVLLRQAAGDPVLDIFVALLFAVVAYLLGLPVSSEAAQTGRVAARAWLIGLTLVTGLASLATSSLQLFRYEPQVIARSADGQRAVALVSVYQNRQVERQVHVFAGSGAWARDQGSVGLACGSEFTVRFAGPDQLELLTTYGTFDLSLDPATGRPVNGIGQTCSG